MDLRSTTRNIIWFLEERLGFPVQVVDQIGNPTWARMLAEVSGLILARGFEHIDEHKGLYHLAGDGYASQSEWAREILALDSNSQEQIVKDVQPAKTVEFPTPAKRPLFSALDCQKFSNKFGLMLPNWRMVLMLTMNNRQNTVDMG